MGSGSSLPYRLRPNKAVDRELFLALLTRLAPKMGLQKYHYVGLGGPFLEDFRLLHSRIGIGGRRAGRTVGRLTCVESEPDVHKRQLFNRPVASIKCVHSTLEDFLDRTTFSTPAIIWFDYTEPIGRLAQMRRFASTINKVPLGSILRITVNAQPEPRPADQAVTVDLQEWRRSRFSEQFGTYVPSGIDASEMTLKRFGPMLLKVLALAVAGEEKYFRDRRIVWALATHYADGQAMVTAALVVCPREDTATEKLVRGWEFFATPDNPHRLDLPALSSLERLTLESTNDARRKLGFDLAKVVESRLGGDPFDVFKKFYRLYPHFSRVEL
jgi:hypothetical protein